MYNTHYLIFLFRTTANVCDAKLEVMLDVRGSFLEQLRQLIETARQMVSALQRTSKLRTTTGGENVSMYSINSILPERVGVGEAPNSHYLLYFI